jgi:hypothetical protein
VLALVSKRQLASGGTAGRFVIAVFCVSKGQSGNRKGMLQTRGLKTKKISI